MNTYILYQLLILLNFLFLITCYNNTNLKRVTADDIEHFDREKDGYAGCNALYDSGANETETCTQFKLEIPYICCKVHYKIGEFTNDFCMPISNNEKSLSDVEKAFKNADEVYIDCYSLYFKFHFYLFLIFFILLI